MLATEKAPTSQPARVKGTHGAGAILLSSLTICGLPSEAFAVQYRNELLKPTENPNPMPGTNNWYTSDGYSGGSGFDLRACSGVAAPMRRIEAATAPWRVAGAHLTSR